MSLVLFSNCSEFSLIVSICEHQFCAEFVAITQFFCKVELNEVMARNKFGEVLRARVVDEYNKGMTQKDISIKYNIHKSSISRIIANFIKNKTIAVVHRGGRPRKTDERTDKLIAREVKKYPFRSAPQLVKELGLPISSKTASRRLAEADFRTYRPAKKPLISKRYQQKRLQFARDHIDWPLSKWKAVLFSDESKFNLVGSDGVSYVRRPRNKRLQKSYCVKTVKHSAYIMVWGCFSAAGLGPLHRIMGIMDQYVYRDIMESVMLPHAEWEMPLKWVFQQDNDPKHTAKVLKSWFQRNKVDVMEWPPQSPDLNPIENLWEIVKKRTDRTNVANTDQFFQRVLEAWRNIPQTIVDNLIASIPRRCRAVIQSNGFATKY